ncbi:MAG: hypothetical protein E7337_00550 [Clostridiales bacterium]|nr:hypothetical protein [Clostridiales bacterium]
MNNGTDIALALKTLQGGGKVFVPAGSYDICAPVVMDIPCQKLEGEVWNYSSDPNGVFESRYGTKLRMRRNDIPAIDIAPQRVLGGNVIRDIGIQGNISGMDTRGLFDFSNPAAASGLYFGGQRIDQAEFSKISFCGLASAVCAAGDSEIDACTFEKLNTDGCCIGIYFSPRAAFYPMFRQCIVADNPAYGFFADGRGRIIHNVEVSECRFVRNGGAFPEDGLPHAAVCLYHINKCALRDNLIDDPGTFWYYDPNATCNDQRQPSHRKTTAIHVEGCENRITGNTVLNSSAESIVVKGDRNILLNNIVDGDIVVEGTGNILSGNVFTKPEARLVLKGKCEGTQISGIPEDRIVRM